MNANHKQQGDVVLKLVESLPSGQATLVKPGPRGHVLAEGEITGHAHSVEADTATMTEIGGKLFLTVLAQTTVRHEEHKPVELVPGIWEIGRVVEYDYLAQMARTVAD